MKWLKNLFCPVETPVEQPNELKQQLEAVRGLLDNERTINAQLNVAFGLLAADFAKKREGDQQAIAWLVSMMGNNVVVSMDLIKMMREADLYINYQATDDGLLIQLLTEEEAQVLRAEAAKKEAVDAE